MEYERKVVSLYGDMSFSGLPVSFVEIRKEADKVKMIVSLFKEKSGWIFVCLKNKCFCFDLSKRREFIFDDDFFCENEYFFVIINSEKSLFGKIGNPDNIDEKYEKIKRKYESIKKQNEYLSSYDKNFITHSLVLKMFGAEESIFFEQTKRQMQTLFMMNKRFKPLESRIPFSKFVKVGDGEEFGVAGVVYKNNKAFAIAVGFQSQIENYDFDQSSLQFFDCKTINSGGIFLSCRSATDAEICFV